MNHKIENEFLSVTISERGAELQSIIRKQTGQEHLWQGDPVFWPRRAPILFPIVGRLKNDTMMYDGNVYHMPQHGFARDMDFIVEKSERKSILLTSKSNDLTKKLFPFDWELSCSYRLEENELYVSASVTNTHTEKMMYFSIGFHPGFILPMDPGLRFEDYYIHFNHDKTGYRWCITDAMIGDQEKSLCISDHVVHLKNDTFKTDALVFKGLKSDIITICNDHTGSKLKFSFKNFPYLGIWSKPNAPFICLEPWQGIADSIYHNGNFSEKEGIIKLISQKSFECGYSVQII